MSNAIKSGSGQDASFAQNSVPCLRDVYQKYLAQRDWQPDLAQIDAIELLQKMLVLLMDRYSRSLGFSNQIKGYVRQFLGQACRYEPMVGLYLWGGVGRGKTFLMDLFYESCPLELKCRSHYHRFMRQIHQDLAKLQGLKNPLELVADRIASRACVLCLDEFFVKDIGDAMILGNLLRALFERGVVLIATSNLVPDRLYENGLQRQRFLPAIDLIQKNTRVFEMGAGKDFRLQTLSSSALYLCPNGKKSERSLEELMLALAPEAIRNNVTISVCGRDLTARAIADDVAWFDFEELCGGPRSVADYIEIAEDFTAVLISGVPQFSLVQDDLARRFIHLVDEFYDRRVKLALSAQASPEQLYSTKGQLSFEFDRTVSRLREMQSDSYLSRSHGQS